MINIDGFLEFHIITEKLKYLKRTGWILRKVPDPESVASHTFRMALMALTLQTELKAEGIDLLKVLKMVLYHDIGESIIGDLVPEHIEKTGNNNKSINQLDKHKIELQAFESLAGIINDQEIVKLWKEIEEGETKEALIVKDIDLIDMALQASQYKQRYPHLSRLDEFLPYCIQNIKTQVGRDILNVLAKKAH